MALDPHHEAKQAFAAHWESVTLTRSSLTFDGAEPNHDHVVRIAQPSKTTGSSRSTSSKPAKRPAVTIPVIIAF